MSDDALSDLLLAAACLILAWRNARQRPGAAVALGLIGFAASLGVMRYSGLEQAFGPHRFASMVAACAGLPLLAASLRWPEEPIAAYAGAAGRFAIVAGAVGVVMVAVLAFPLWGQMLPALAALTLLFTAAQNRRPAQLAGSLILSAGFAATAAGWMVAPMNGVQLLHVSMAAALPLLMSGPAGPLEIHPESPQGL